MQLADNIIPFHCPNEVATTENALFTASYLRSPNALGDETFYKNQRPCFFNINLETGNVMPSNAIKYPYIEKGNYYPNFFITHFFIQLLMTV